MAERQQLACPVCGSGDLVTLEQASCVALTNGIFTDGPEWDGYTDYERGTQVTVGVLCDGCDWNYTGDDWLSKLVPLVTDEEV